ncbi:MAG: LLM class flavin-dependent oxidoreductase [Acidimicrobiia bacterium]
MKIRIGFGLGTRASSDGDRFAGLVDSLEELGFDSLWLSERLTGDCPDPIVGLSVAAGRTTNLKLGTGVAVLPGRNPVVVAKAWATLDRLSGGRTLPAFGLGVPDPGEHAAFGVAREERATWFDEALPLIRRLWSEEVVHHHGPRFHLDGVRLAPKPLQKPPDVWLGGLAPSELRRIGRLGDGWLASFCTPDDVTRARPVIEDAAGAAGRAIDPGHWGALVPYLPANTEPPPELVELLRRRRPDVDLGTVIFTGRPAVRHAVDVFVDAGVSKFVLVPLVEPPSWDDELGELAATVLPAAR